MYRGGIGPTEILLLLVILTVMGVLVITATLAITFVTRRLGSRPQGARSGKRRH